MEIKGICVKAAKRKTGTNARGDWSNQYVQVKTEQGTVSVCVWNRADLASAEGKILTITGTEEGTDKSGKACFILQSGEGSIEAKEIQRTTQASAQKNVAAGKYERPTQTEYEAVVGRVIDFVHSRFSKHQNVDAQAIAHVVNGIMVAYSKGDFLVENAKPAEAEKKVETKLDDDIPF
jgi:hypothetical protein